MMLVMRTTVNIAEPLLENAKLQAAQRGVTLSDVVEDGLRMLLATPRPTNRRKFKLKTVAGTLVDPSIDLNKTSLLIIADDEAGHWS